MSMQKFVYLSPEELKQRGEQLAATVVELDELKEDKKQAGKDFKEKEEQLSARARRLSQSIRTGGEYRLDDRQRPLFDESTLRTDSAVESGGIETVTLRTGNTEVTTTPRQLKRVLEQVKGEKARAEREDA